MSLVEKYIGQWGLYQAYVFSLFLLTFAISGMQTMGFAFTGGVPAHRCLLSSYDDPINPDYHLPFPKNTTNYFFTKPVKERGKDAYCYYCPGGFDEANKLSGKKCELQDQVACTNGYVYDRSQYHKTLGATFNMVCSDGAWKHSLASSFFMVGFLIGASVSGSLSDRYGRRPIYMMTSLLGIVIYHLVILSPNLIVLCILYFLSGALCNGAYLTGFVIIMECIGGRWATACGIIVQAMFAIGALYLGVCAYFIRDWKWLQLAISLPSIFLISHCWLAPESVRWLIIHGRGEEAKKLIRRGAGCNKIQINESELDKDVDSVMIAANATALDLLREKHLAMVTMIVFYSYFAADMAYYGISQNTSDFPGDDYVKFVIMIMFELLGLAVAIPTMDKWGRRLSCVIFFGFGGVAVIICPFLPKNIPWLIIVFVGAGKAGVAASFAVMYNYSAELFPTVARNSGIGIASACARVASISAPQVHLTATYVAPFVPYLVYGLLSMLAAALVLLLPETLNSPLPETILDGINQAKGRSTST